ncbi:hypothetical protein [Streptomyces sp. SD15]
MSYLLNPSFEDKDVQWQRVNIPSAVSYDIVQGTAQVPAKSGDFYLAVRSTVPGGSIAQDFTIQGVRSISAFAWVRARVGQVRGTLAIWQLGPPDRPMPARFTAGSSDWTLVTSTLDLTNVGSSKTLRIEFYLDTPSTDLLIDSVNAF